MKPINWKLPLIIAVLVYLLASGTIPLPGTPSNPTTKATAATYVYEKDETRVPPAVQSGLNRLNRERGIVATLCEDDDVDGTGEISDQYKVPITAARQAGLPSLVVTAGDTVLNVLKNPQTEEQVMGAVGP